MSNDSYHLDLARSYLAYFVASFVGLFIDSVSLIHFSIPHALIFAIICFALGPILIIWAQTTSSRYKNNGGYFTHGPYRFLRNPTHLGLVILVTGYTLISQSIFFFAMTLIGYIVSNMYFRKYEHALSEEEKGYATYKSSVRKIL